MTIPELLFIIGWYGMAVMILFVLVFGIVWVVRSFAYLDLMGKTAVVLVGMVFLFGFLAIVGGMLIQGAP